MTSLGRRTFLEQLALGSAGALVVGSHIGGCRGSDPPVAVEKDTAAPFPPSDLINVAIIGMGPRGMALAEEFSYVPGCDVSSICDVDKKRLDAGARKLTTFRNSRPRVEQDFRRTLEDENVDAVVLAIPHHWHALAAIWAMQAGKHVYIEKPVTHTLEEGTVLRAAAEHYGRVVQSGTQMRSDSTLRAAASHVRDGMIGNVKLAICIAYKPKKSIGPTGEHPAPKWVDQDLWSGPAPIGPFARKRFHYDWHWFWDYGNGALGNYGPHRIDIARLGLGIKGAGDRAISMGGRFGYHDAGETPNTQLTIHQFGDKTIIHDVRALPTGSHMGCKTGVLFIGEDAFVKFESGRAYRMGYHGEEPEKLKPEKLEDDQGEETHQANFVRAVRQSDPSVLNGGLDEGIFTASACHVGNISHRLGQRRPDSEIMAVLEGLPGDDELVYAFARLRSHLGKNNSRSTLTLGPNLSIDPASGLPLDDGAAQRLSRGTYRAPFSLPATESI